MTLETNQILLESSWSFGVGDPTLAGWLVTAGYLAGSFVCLRSWRVSRDIDGRSGENNSTPFIKLSLFWMFCTVVMLLLGLNKQLDLQTLLIELYGNVQAESYSERESGISQNSFFVLFTASAVYLLITVEMVLKNWLFEIRLAHAGLALVLIYIVYRAAEIYQFQGVLLPGTVLDQLLHLTEPVGILLVILPALRFTRQIAQLSNTGVAKLDAIN